MDLSPPDYESPGQTRCRLRANPTRPEGQAVRGASARQFSRLRQHLARAVRSGRRRCRIRGSEGGRPTPDRRPRAVSVPSRRTDAHLHVRRDSSRPTIAGHCSCTTRIASGPATRSSDVSSMSDRAMKPGGHGRIVHSPRPRRRGGGVRARPRRARHSPSSTRSDRVAARVPMRRARAASSSLNTSSSRSTGAAPVSSAVTWCPASRNASARTYAARLVTRASSHRARSAEDATRRDGDRRA